MRRESEAKRTNEHVQSPRRKSSSFKYFKYPSSGGGGFISQFDMQVSLVGESPRKVTSDR